MGVEVWRHKHQLAHPDSAFFSAVTLAQPNPALSVAASHATGEWGLLWTHHNRPISR